MMLLLQPESVCVLDGCQQFGLQLVPAAVLWQQQRVEAGVRRGQLVSVWASMLCRQRGEDCEWCGGGRWDERDQEKVTMWGR